jgi:transposase-like protein
LNGYAASHSAMREMKAESQMLTDTELRSSKYLNNLVEQDHRGVKSRIGPMLGFKRVLPQTLSMHEQSSGTQIGLFR